VRYIMASNLLDSRGDDKCRRQDAGRDQATRGHARQKAALQKGVADAVPRRRGGVALELFAGAGHSVIAGIKGLKHIAVEPDAKRAGAYKRRHAGAQVFTEKWEKALPKIGLDKLDLCAVDIDPFGHPFEAIKALFKSASIRQPMLLMVTYGWMNERMKAGMDGPGAVAKMDSAVRSAARGLKVKRLRGAIGGVSAYAVYSVIRQGTHLELHGMKWVSPATLAFGEEQGLRTDRLEREGAKRRRREAARRAQKSDLCWDVLEMLLG